jgi:hypothetical protein
MKKAGMHVGPSEGGGKVGLLHHPFDLCPVRMGDEERPPSSAPREHLAFQAFFITLTWAKV